MTEEKTKIPKGPWMVETLGEELYTKLAIEYGVFNPNHQPTTFRPALDLTAAYDAQEGTKSPTTSSKPKNPGADAGK